MIIRKRSGGLTVELDLCEPSPDTAHVLRVLQQLAANESEFATTITQLREQYQLRERFTPRQMLLVQWRLSKHGVEHEPSRFVISTRIEKEIAQIRSLEEWQKQKLAPYLSWPQRSRFGF